MGLMAGFAKADITPLMGIGLSGYYVARRAEGVLDALEARALALRLDGRTVVLISVDNCGLAPTAVYDQCRAQVSGATGIAPEAVFIAATHTHTSPDWGEAYAASEEYTAWFRHRLADAARGAVDDLRPARMGYGVGSAPDVAFVRRFRMADGSVRTNPGVNHPTSFRPLAMWTSG